MIDTMIKATPERVGENGCYALNYKGTNLDWLLLDPLYEGDRYHATIDEDIHTVVSKDFDDKDSALIWIEEYFLAGGW